MYSGHSSSNQSNCQRTFPATNLEHLRAPKAKYPGRSLMAIAHGRRQCQRSTAGNLRRSKTCFRVGRPPAASDLLHVPSSKTCHEQPFRDDPKWLSWSGRQDAPRPCRLARLGTARATSEPRQTTSTTSSASANPASSNTSSNSRGACDGNPCLSLRCLLPDGACNSHERWDLATQIVRRPQDCFGTVRPKAPAPATSHESIML